ncbi:LacI family DNA-binding transcriptional regulator [Pantoea rwandensis]|uniref:LacI family transcriptional regulator n=1 Tax=Pantoea rwandensis TaxID=1076550 RepID=A0A1X1D383_9GAMM|nr:LacI family DNA-binding transcriptional regulator [Pantoea rwandensis]ORM71138.1 LacI family transcriptional regulator [Pantoea rwandensis]
MKSKESRVTASDVARLAGVSKWTVSRAFMPGASISDSARERVLSVARDLGYRPNLLARSLAKKKTHIIGVVIDEMKNPHTLMLLDEASRQLQSRGYMAMMLNISADAHYPSVMAQADQFQVDGILFLGTVLSAELISLSQDLYRVPLVQVCRYSNAADIEVVAIDGMGAGMQISELMVAQGYSRFGYMVGPDTPSSHTFRKEGFEAGLAKAGHQLDVVLNAGGYDKEMGWNAISDYLLSTPTERRIEALFCENDVLALGAMSARQELAPEWHLGIAGFDDIDEAQALNWQLTTFSQRIDRLVNEALNRLIDGRVNIDNAWQQGELRIRRSHLKA